MKVSAGSWHGYPIAHPDHTVRLDQGAHIAEFEHHLPQSEARAKAHQDYVREQRIEAATHHLRGLKAAEAAGDEEAAEKHGIMYALHCQAIGHEPVGAPHPDVVARMEKSPEKLYRFRPHRGDMFAVSEHDDKGGEEPTKMDKNEKDEQALKELTLYALSLGAKALLAKADKVYDPERKKNVEVVGEKTVGTSAPTHKVKPRLIGSAVDKFKDTMGVCKHSGCAKIAGHGGDHTPVKKSEVPETSMERAMKKSETSPKGKHCRCDVYSFPHRHGGGKCKSGK